VDWLEVVLGAMPVTTEPIGHTTQSAGACPYELDVLTLQLGTHPSPVIPFYLLLNLAVGGTWPGSPDASTQFPANLLVNYVRGYAKA
jgi:beta-glucanase (GH16 family)